MTPRALANLAGVTPNMVYTYLRHGRIEHQKLNGKYVIDDAYGQEWARAHNVKRAARNQRNQQKIQQELKGNT